MILCVGNPTLICIDRNKINKFVVVLIVVLNYMHSLLLLLLVMVVFLFHSNYITNAS